jgi:hypothetical protein
VRSDERIERIARLGGNWEESIALELGTGCRKGGHDDVMISALMQVRWMSVTVSKSGRADRMENVDRNGTSNPRCAETVLFFLLGPFHPTAKKSCCSPGRALVRQNWVVRAPNSRKRRSRATWAIRMFESRISPVIRWYRLMRVSAKVTKARI